jgi:outer membrane protein OmpA-like peptidoglycan-associated protein
MAEKLAGGTQPVRVIGTTASADTPAARRELSLARAAAVRDLLVGGGVSRDRINIVGAGATRPDRLDDRGPDGALLPGPAALNRSVIIEVTCRG